MSTYLQVMYALEPQPPYAVVNVSYLFRLRALKLTSKRASAAATWAAQANRTGAWPDRVRRDLDAKLRLYSENIQFASGLVPLDERTVLVTYGIHDCWAASACTINSRHILYPNVHLSSMLHVLSVAKRPICAAPRPL